MIVEVCVLARDFEAACEAMAGAPGVAVVCKSIVGASHATIASAGNSFGGMSGGVDGIVNTHLSSFTPESYVQDLVKRRILRDFDGELPVGAAVAVATMHPRHTALIYAPTMRVPGPLPADTIAPYLAFRAVLVTAVRVGVDAVSVPLFGTGAGEVSVRKACMQMHAALESIDALSRITNSPNELTLARRHHTMLLGLC
jgi:O-acetyl-ADP-ribose deacetylase (regulator of RNase III)